MENSSETTNKTLSYFHEQIFEAYLPVFVTLNILAVFGVIGNAMTIKYYMCKDTQKPVIWLILTLARVDFLVCILLFAAAAELGVNVLFESRILCKTIYFLDYAFVYSSIMILALVSVDRYRKICQPFGKQITIRLSKYVVVILVLTAFTISSRAFVTYDVVEITLHETSSQTVVGYQCETTDAPNLKFVVGFFHYFDTVTVGAIFVVFVLAYALILRSLYIHQERVQRLGKNPKRPTHKGHDEHTPVDEMPTQTQTLESEDVAEDISSRPCRIENVKTVTKDIRSHIDSIENLSNDVIDDRDAENKGESKLSISEGIKDVNGVHIAIVGKISFGVAKSTTDGVKDGGNTSETLHPTKSGNTIISHLTNTQNSPENAHTNKIKGHAVIKPNGNEKRVVRLKKYEIQTTVMMLFVSVGFLVSFTPYFIASIGIMYSSAIDPDKPRVPIEASTHMMQKCAFLNSVINPIIYYIFNNDYRRFVRTLFCKSNVI